MDFSVSRGSQGPLPSRGEERIQVTNWPSRQVKTDENKGITIDGRGGTRSQVWRLCSFLYSTEHVMEKEQTRLEKSCLVECRTRGRTPDRPDQVNWYQPHSGRDQLESSPYTRVSFQKINTLKVNKTFLLNFSYFLSNFIGTTSPFYWKQ